MVDESQSDQQKPDDATVVKAHNPDADAAAAEPYEDATVAAPRPATEDKLNTDHAPATQTADRPDAFTTRPVPSVSQIPPQSVLRSPPVAIALGVVTGLVMFGLTALWLLHGR